MNVSQANPFTAMDLSATNTTLPSLASSTAVDGLECTDGDLLRAVPMARRKHSKSSEFVGSRKKGRKKRACISFPFVPLRANGPQEMYAYEFMVDVDPPPLLEHGSLIR